MEQEKKKSKLKIIISIVALIILAVIGIVVFTSNKGTPGENGVNENGVNKETQETQQAEEKKDEPNPFKIDAVYCCLSGSNDPADYGITTKQYFERNPQMKEENLKDNDTITLYVFASLNSLESGQKDVNIPSSYYDRSLPGNTLITNIYYDNYTNGTSYEFNNSVNNRLSKHWNKYKDGKTLETSDILFAGSNESRFIVSQFNIKYHFYKQAIKNNTEFKLVWKDANNSFSYQATFNGKDIEKQNTLTDIENSLKEKGLI